MAADPRVWAKLHEFFLQWLKVDQVPDLAKDAKRFPDFDAATASDLRTSLELLLENVVESERSDTPRTADDGQILSERQAGETVWRNLPPDASSRR